MKAVLEFNLDDSEDQFSYYRCVKSKEMASILFHLQANFWNQFKDTKEISKIREKLAELYQENNINIEELIN